ncbi:hypothetical protein [Burkholderia phage FLC9]|nr:hypothetical protein [Burkholderia phage FLC9]
MEQQEDKKVPLILFSGGMDSTFLVQWFLQYGDVETVFVKADPHPFKRKKEADARRKLFGLFEKYYKHRVLHDHEYDLDRTFSQHQRLNGVQQISWLVAALAIYEPSRHHSVNIGYVLGDQAPAFRKQYEDFWSAGWTMTRGVLDPVPPLLFPILNHQLTKYDVLDRIDKRLVSSTWVCEMPKYEGEYAHKKLVACKHCKPCRLLKHTIEDWELATGQNYMGEVIKAMNPQLYPSSLLNELKTQAKDPIESK